MLLTLLAGWFFLLAGTYLLTLRLYVWDAGLCLGLGLLLLSRPLYRAFYPSAPVRAAAAPPRLRDWWTAQRMAVLRGGALGLALLVGLLARRQAPDGDFTALFGAWLIALLLFVLTLPRWRVTVCTSSALLLGLLLFAALLLRITLLDRIPGNLGGDEGTQALLGLQLIERPLGNPFATSWYAVPTLSLLLYGIGMRLFGVGIAGARALSALVGTLTVGTTFLLGRELGGRRMGWVAALVVASSSYHLHFSRLASNQIFDPLVATLGFWLLWRAWKGGNAEAAAWGWAGVVLGFGWYTYFGARWVTVMAAAFLGWRMLVEPQFWERQRRGIGLLGLGWLVMTAPLWLWYVAHPADLTARSNAVSIFASGWLTQEMALTGRSVLAVLGQQFWKAVTAFHLTPDPTFWYHPQAPLLDFISGALLLVGMLAAVLRAHWPGRGLTLGWFWSTLLTAWVLTENPPSSQRGLLLIPAVALCIAWGVEAFIEVTRRLRTLPVLWVQRGLGVLLAVMVALNLGFYFGIYTPRRVYGNPSAWVATEVARYCLQTPAEGLTYFFGAPYLYWDFGTLAFLLRAQPGVDVPPGEVPEVTAPARFIFVPERAAELLPVRERYPGGHLVALQTPDQRLLAWIYDW